MTRGKPCVKILACRTHSKPCVTMHASWRMYKWEFIEEGRSKNKEKEKGKGKKEREKEKKGREREKRKSAFRWSELVEPRCKGYIFDEAYAPRGRDSSYFGLVSTLRVVWLCLCPKGLFGRISKYGNAALF